MFIISVYPHAIITIDTHDTWPSSKGSFLDSIPAMIIRMCRNINYSTPLIIHTQKQRLIIRR